MQTCEFQVVTVEDQHVQLLANTSVRQKSAVHIWRSSRVRQKSAVHVWRSSRLECWTCSITPKILQTTRRNPRPLTLKIPSPNASPGLPECERRNRHKPQALGQKKPNTGRDRRQVRCEIARTSLLLGGQMGFGLWGL